MTKYIRKTRDQWTLQGYYAPLYKWEDLTSEDTYKQIRERMKEYRLNEPCPPLKIVYHRVKVQS